MIHSQGAGLRQTDELLRFLKFKIEQEDRVAVELAKAARVPLEEHSQPRETSLNAALWNLRTYTEQRRTDQHSFVQAFELQVRRPLEDAQSTSRQETLSLKADAVKAVKACVGAETKSRKARDAVHAARADVAAARSSPQSSSANPTRSSWRRSATRTPSSAGTGAGGGSDPASSPRLLGPVATPPPQAAANAVVVFAKGKLAQGKISQSEYEAIVRANAATADAWGSDLTDSSDSPFRASTTSSSTPLPPPLPPPSAPAAAAASGRTKSSKPRPPVSPPPVATRHDEKLAAAEDASAAAKQALLSCIAARDRAMEEVSCVTDKIEGERQRHMATCLERFVNLERQHLKEQARQLDALAATVASIDSGQDVRRIVDHFRTQDGASASAFQATLASSSRQRIASLTGSSAVGADGVGSGAFASECGVSAEVASMTQTRGYSRALSLLDWDFKRHREKQQQEEQNPELGNSEDAEHEAIAASEAEKRAQWSTVSQVCLAANRVLAGEQKEERGNAKHRLKLDQDLVSSAPTGDLVRLLVSSAPAFQLDQEEQGGLSSRGSVASVSKGEAAVALQECMASVAPSVVAAELVERCSEPLGRAAMLQVLNESRTGEVLVGGAAGNESSSSSIFSRDGEGSVGGGDSMGSSGLPVKFEALCSVFEGALRFCDEQRDVRHAKQLMIMSDSYKGFDFLGVAGVGKGSIAAKSGGESESEQRSSSSSAPLSRRLLRTQSSIGSGVVYVQAAIRNHVLWGRRWFWEEVLLGGITEQFKYNQQEVPWEDLTPNELHDEVCRVHNTVFAQLGAVVSNMARFLRGEDEIRAFLVKMCTRSQLVEEQVVQLNGMLEKALRKHNPHAALSSSSSSTSSPSSSTSVVDFAAGAQVGTKPLIRPIDSEAPVHDDDSGRMVEPFPHFDGAYRDKESPAVTKPGKGKELDQMNKSTTPLQPHAIPPPETPPPSTTAVGDLYSF